MAVAARRSGDPRAVPTASSGSVLLREEEWQLLRVCHPNVLITGDIARTAPALAALAPLLPQPILSWEPGVPLVLPAIGTVRTLILREVAELSAAEQRQLFAWLDVPRGGTQVVATTARPLLQRAEAGAFDLRLYYRLNVIYLELAA